MSELAGASFVCPRCRALVRANGDAYECSACASMYPVVLGIPDFRVAPDPWINMEDDRAKGLELERRTDGQGLEAMVRAYWAMTPTTPAAQADRFIAHVLRAEQRSREWIAAHALTSTGEQWLDIGAGTADLAAAAGNAARVTSVDVAFRWLVVARRRLQLAGMPLDLVCANAEALPFADAAFDRAWSSGTIEHVTGQRAMLRETHRVLRPGGALHLRTVNRYSLLPEPHVGVLGVGWLPRGLADDWVRFRTGQRYLHHRLLSARELRNMLGDAGFTGIDVAAARLLGTDRERLGTSALALLLPAYERLRRAPLLSRAVAGVAPLLDATATRR